MTLFNTYSVPTFVYVLPIESNPVNIYWISQNNILISYPNQGEIFNLESRQRNKLEDCTNCIYGYDKEILRCEYVHREISSPEEFSTSISVYNSKNELIFQQDLFPTVIPISCKKDSLILKSAYSFLEQKIYILDTKDGEFKEYEKKEKIYPQISNYKNISVGGKYIVSLEDERLLKIYLRTQPLEHILPYQQ